jgi:hypothetical protein
VSRESVTLRGRSFAEPGMVDTCTITRVTGGTTDPETGVRTETTTTVYTGKCRVRQPTSTGSRHDVGEASIVEVGSQLQLPMAASDIRTEDRAEIDTSALDPDLPGRVYVIGAPVAGTHLTSRRYQITEVTS